MKKLKEEEKNKIEEIRVSFHLEFSFQANVGLFIEEFQSVNGHPHPVF